MPKRVFWPLSLVIMGLIFLASNLGLLPKKFWDLWPLILIVVGLGGLVTSDKEEWDGQPKSTLRKSKNSGKKRANRKK